MGYAPSAKEGANAAPSIDIDELFDRIFPVVTHSGVPKRALSTSKNAKLSRCGMRLVSARTGYFAPFSKGR